MIPRAHVTVWRAQAPWATDAQVEQDLVVCRALVDLYSDDILSREVAFRGAPRSTSSFSDRQFGTPRTLISSRFTPNRSGPCFARCVHSSIPGLGSRAGSRAKGG